MSIAEDMRNKAKGKSSKKPVEEDDEDSESEEEPDEEEELDDDEEEEEPVASPPKKIIRKADAPEGIIKDAKKQADVTNYKINVIDKIGEIDVNKWGTIKIDGFLTLIPYTLGGRAVTSLVLTKKAKLELLNILEKESEEAE